MKEASGAALPTRNNGLPGGPRSSDVSATPSAAGYQTVTRTAGLCVASRRAAVGLVAVRWRSPTGPARAAVTSKAAPAATASTPGRRAILGRAHHAAEEVQRHLQGLEVALALRHGDGLAE